MVRFLLKFSGKSHSKQYKIVSLIIGAIFFLAVLPCIFMFIGFFMRKYININLNKIIELPVSIIGITAGLCFLIWTSVTQWKVGNGTPAPNAPTQRLITGGPYRYCRNPIEFGAIIYYLGIGTLLGGIITGITCFILGFTAGSIYHKFIEERELEERFGEEYKRYKENTPFIFPKIKTGNKNN
ncbi:MAG: isoprenylcysteine carboxylmethyltransferase family protein [Tannerella sp.]|jgi:protein-S-isoprenylcysteine O-methyltransferase Ste14|nr:isoprenylcysteine carboxylmethyltransferase family protein [Tannerella sp.]